jgi:signal peptidase I
MRKAAKRWFQLQHQPQGVMKSTKPTLGDANARKRELAGEVLHSSGSLRLRVTGWSMLPVLWPGDTLVIEPATGDDIAEGDIVTFSNGRRFVAHRVVSRTSGPADPRVQTQGDAIPHLDAPVPSADLLGRVSVILRDGRCVQPRKSLRFSERALAAVFRRCQIAARVVVGLHGMRRFAQDSSQL